MKIWMIMKLIISEQISILSYKQKMIKLIFTLIEINSII